MSVRETPSTKSAWLIITEHSPRSYSPAGERIRHIALASESAFGRAFVLAVGSGAKKATKIAYPTFLLYDVGLSKELPYPINAYFDPIKFILLYTYTCFLSLRYRPSYILASMPPCEVGVSACLAAKLLGIDLVVDLRDDWESAVKRNLSHYIPEQLLEVVFWLARRVYSSASVLIVATQTIAETAKKRGIETPTILASNGADTSLFFPRDEDLRKRIRKRFALPEHKTIVLYCGSGANVYYRLDHVLSSVRSLPDEVKQLFFFVFYLYDGIEIVRKMKDKLQISDDLVEVREPVPRVVLAEVMAACDVGLVPFDDERYLLCARSAKLYEYLSAGLYVVGSGPKDGELNQLLSNNRQLGTFCLPSVKNFLNVFLGIIKDKAYILDAASRSLRHRFIQENYERRMIAVKAMKTINSLLIPSSAERQDVV